MNFDLEIFHKFDFTGAQITAHNVYGSGTKNSFSELNLQGNFERDQYENCKFWDFWFNQAEAQNDMTLQELTGKQISFFDICPDGECFLVKIIVRSDSSTEEITFRCQNVNPNYYRYKGMSYRNLYGTTEYQERIDRQKYVLDKKYLIHTEESSLPDGFSIETALYQDSPNQTYKAYLQKCILKKSDKIIYEYLCAYHHGARFKDFIYHSNGRRYFPFHVDLYGINYLDLDSLETYHYVPEGYAHDFSYSCGESFIITDIHYDKKTDLVAYGGCYWAGPYGVMVGDFSEPLNFSPKLFSVSQIADPENEGYEIDFKEWQDDRLIVTIEGEERSISIEEIRRLL